MTIRTHSDNTLYTSRTYTRIRTYVHTYTRCVIHTTHCTQAGFSSLLVSARLCSSRSSPSLFFLSLLSLFSLSSLLFSLALHSLSSFSLFSPPRWGGWQVRTWPSPSPRMISPPPSPPATERGRVGGREREGERGGGGGKRFNQTKKERDNMSTCTRVRKYG